LALCLAATASQKMTARVGTPAPASAALEDFATDQDFYEGVEEARLNRGDRDDRGNRVGLRLASASSATALRPAVFSGRVVRTINVTTATDRPITCTFGISSNDPWDFTYDAHITDPNNAWIASGTRWVNNKYSMRGALTTTLTDPIVAGTYRCVIAWHAISDSTNEEYWLPPSTVPLSITP
jgi:hypothetical protein